MLVLQLSPLQTQINYPSTLKTLIKDSKGCSENHLRETFKVVVQTLNQFNLKNDYTKLLEWYDKSKNKHQTSKKLLFGSGDSLNFSVVTNLFLCAHYNCADIPMLSDFEEFKDKLSIVIKSFVTLGNPVKIHGMSLYLRDTQLLAPGGKGSLEQLGDLYKGEGDYSKIYVS